MYKKEFEKELQGPFPYKSVLLYGESDFFIDFYGEKIAKRWGSKEERLSFYFDEYDFSSAKNFISQASLFEENNILIVKHDKKIPKKEIDTLIELCNKNKKSFFLFQFYGDDQKAKDISKSFTKKKNAIFVRFFKPYLKEAIDILSQKAKEKNISIERYALEHLYFLQNEDLSLAATELEKLSLLDKKIDIKDIEQTVYGLGNISLEDFIEKVLRKENIKEPLLKIMESGAGDPVSIINALENYVTQLFMFHIYIKIYGKIDAKEITGYNMPPFIAQKRAELSIKIPLQKYKEMLNFLTEVELKLKNSQNIEKNSLLFSSLIKFQTFL